MNLHEYQAKELLAKYGLPVQQGILANTPEEAANAFRGLAGKFAVIKAQVHAGGRGKAGGVKVVKSADEAADRTSTVDAHPHRIQLLGFITHKPLIMRALRSVRLDTTDRRVRPAAAWPRTHPARRRTSG